LREVCGLTTEAVAAAFLASPATVAQRIVRAKAKIRDAGIPYQVPERPEWPERLESVLQVIYLVFNEGYLSATGPDPLRPDLCSEAIRLGRLLCGLVKEPEAEGLLALMLLHDARRAARLRDRALVPLDRQDQSLWNQDQIAEGRALVTRLLAGHVGTYGVQAAIALEHSAPVTDWARVCGFYDLLLRLDAGPLAELSRAYAVGRRDGPAAGLALVDALAARGDLAGSHLLPATRAELLGRLDRTGEAIEAYREALAMAGTEAEKAVLALSLKEMLAR
jgi:RNA polymerase sigma-70 factor, ECF subfamily